MKQTLWQAVFLLGLCVLPALATAWWHPRSPYLADASVQASESVVLADDEISVSAALSLQEPLLWVDARSVADYEETHIPGAVRLSLDEWEGGVFEVLERVPVEGWVVVYCGSRQCGASREVADRLREEMGLDRVKVLHGGWEAWKAGQP